MIVYLIKGKNDLATLRPDLLKEWDYGKNVIKPSEILCGSTKKVWWICSKGHSWKAQVRNRTSKNEGCPVCANKKILSGYNDFSTSHPDLLKEWDYEKNTVYPTEISFGYRKKIWWKCDKGHNWEGYIYNRLKGHGCPVCSNHKIEKGYNDFATFHPELLKEWDYDKNVISPENIGRYSGKKVWWKCPVCGYSWQTALVKRTKYNYGCPVCKGHAILAGYNDLATLRPDILKYWDYEKNGDLLPTMVGLGSPKKAWFKCEDGHSFYIVIHAFINSVNKCPVCYHLGHKKKSKKGRGKGRFYYGKSKITNEGLEVFE